MGGAIDLKRAEMSTANKIRNDSAHELFHAVQNQYYYTAGMAQRFWFMEGTPDFMAYRYGWNGSIQSQIEPLTLSWFKHSPFENLTDVDAYPLGNFLQYLSTVEAVDIKKLWDDVATWPVNAPQGFRSGVTQQTNKSFDDVWAAFVYESMFGAAALASVPDTKLVVDNSSTEADIQLTLNPGYTARLARIEVQACSNSVKRYFKVGSASEFTGSLAIRLWKATPDGGNPVYLGSLNAASRELANLEVDNSLRVFAIAYNTGASQIPAGLQVTAGDCQVNSGFSKSYPALELYNRDIIGNLDMSVSGPYTSYQEAVLPGLIFLRFKVPTPAAGKTVSYGLSAAISGLKCNGCAIQSYSWNEFGTGTGGSTVVTIDPVHCGGRADFYVKFVNRSTGAFPLSVDIDGCP